MDDTLELRSYAAVTERHDHDYWQVVLPIRGCLDMEVGGRAGAVRQGQGAVIPAGTAHAFQASGENRFLVADMKSIAPDGRTALRFEKHAFFGMAPGLQALLDYGRAGSALSADTAGHWCALLLAALGDAPVPDRALVLGVERALSFMRANLAEPLTVERIAAESGLPLHRLNAAFRTYKGLSPYAALTDLRLREALRLLGETRLPIAEIAQLTGHADQSALTRRLRRHAGASPAAYRRARLSEMA